MTRIRRVESKGEQERLVDEFVTKGYTIADQSQYTAKVKEKDWGDAPTHVFVAIITFIAAALAFDVVGVSTGGAWVVVIVANATYALFSRHTADEVLIKLDESNGG